MGAGLKLARGLARSLSCAACAACVMTVAGAAQADPASHAKAVDLFSRARKRIAAGDCEGAIPKLVESIQNEPSVGAELSLADCYEPTDPLQAWRQVQEAARVASDNHDVRLESVNQRAASMASKLPTVQITVPASQNLPGLEVRLDGAKLDSFVYLRGPVATTPGQHLVDASAAQKKWSQTVDAQAGHPVTVTLDLKADATLVAPPPTALPTTPAVPAPAPAAPEATGGGRRTLGFVVGGVGVAGLGLGAVAGLVAMEQKNTIQTACAGSLSSCQAQQGSQDGALSTARTWATVSTASFIAGGAVLAVGALLVFTAPKRASTASASLVLSPIAGPRQAGAALVGAW
jgi:hypothetical protein